MNERHEQSDIELRPVLWGAAILAAVVGVAGAALHLMYRTDTPLFEPPPAAWTGQSAGIPALQTNPAAELQRLRSEQLARLGSYGWVDRGSAIAHIPIEEAMRELPQVRPKLDLRPQARSP